MSSAVERVLGASPSRQTEGDSGEHWLSVSDLMAGLMIVFLFVSIALMRDAMIRAGEVEEVAVAYQKNQVALYEALRDEFKDDLEKWDADIEKATLSFQFKSPDVLFDTGKIELKPRFQTILEDFFPRYLDVLMGFRDSINEVRVEGHTSSDWNHGATEDEAYFNNMELSQGRTRSVLAFVYDLPEVGSERSWVKEHVAAVGFSSSRVVLGPDGLEDRERSRRVTFRVITNAETQIRKILEK